VYAYDIMGYAYSSSHIFSLFIVYSVALFLNILRKGNWYVPKEYLKYFMFGIVLSILFCLHALFIHHEGTISELLNFLFLYAFMLIFLINRDESCNIQSDVVYEEYGKMCLNIAILIMIQAFFQVQYKYNLVTMSHLVESVNSVRLNSELLYNDISSATIGLAIGSFWYFFYSKSKFRYFFSAIIFLGMIASSARTGFVTFGIIFALKLLFKYKKDIKKLIILCACGLGVIVLVTLLLSYVRGNVLEVGLLNDSGRFELTEFYFGTFKNKLWLGYGLGSDYLQSYFNRVMPHLSLLNIANQVGIIITILLLIFVLYFMKLFCKEKINLDMTLLILLGSCFIPEIWSTKFICLVFALAITKTNSYVCTKSD